MPDTFHQYVFFDQASRDYLTLDFNDLDYKVNDLYQSALQDLTEKDEATAFKKLDILLTLPLQGKLFPLPDGQISIDGDALYFKVLFTLSSFLFYEKKYKESLRYTSQALERLEQLSQPSPKDFETLWRRSSLIHFELKDYAAELLCLEKYLFYNPYDIDALQRKGECLIKVKGDYGLALTYFDAILDLEPDSLNIWMLKKQVHVQLRQKKEATSCMRNICIFGSKEAMSSTDLIKREKIYDVREKSLESLEEVLTKGDDYPQQLSFIEAEKNYLLLLKKISKQKDEYFSFLRCEAFSKLGCLYLEEGKIKRHGGLLQKALSCINQSLELFQPHWNLLYSAYDLMRRKLFLCQALKLLPQEIECLDKLLRMDIDMMQKKECENLKRIRLGTIAGASNKKARFFPNSAAPIQDTAVDHQQEVTTENTEQPLNLNLLLFTSTK